MTKPPPNKIILNGLNLLLNRELKPHIMYKIPSKIPLFDFSNCTFSGASFIELRNFRIM